MEVFCRESIRTRGVGRHSGQKVSLDPEILAHTQGVDKSWSENCCLAECVRLHAVQVERRLENRVHSQCLDRKIYVHSDCAPCRVVRSEIDAHTLRMDT